MAKLFANSGDPDLGLHCLPSTLLQVSQLKWVKEKVWQALSSYKGVVVFNVKYSKLIMQTVKISDQPVYLWMLVLVFTVCCGNIVWMNSTSWSET